MYHHITIQTIIIPGTGGQAGVVEDVGQPHGMALALVDAPGDP